MLLVAKLYISSKLSFRNLQNMFTCTVKPVLSGHSKKNDKTKTLMTNGSLTRSKELQSAPLGAFCNTFDLHYVIIGLESQSLVFYLCGRLRQVLHVLFSLDKLNF